MPPNSQQVINRLVPRWKQLYHHYKSLRSVPFRKHFFIGYDLAGNTYWEFKLESHATNLRRKLIPTKRQDHMFDYYATVPPAWHQWLRFTRKHAPTVDELIADEERLRILKLNSKIIDENWKNLKTHQEEKIDVEVATELQQLEELKAKQKAEQELYLKQLDEKDDPFVKKPQNEQDVIEKAVFKSKR